MKVLFKKVNKKEYKNTFTIALCFSRGWCVKPFFENFRKLKFDKKKCHLIIYDNTDNVILADLLLNFFPILQSYFASLIIYKSGSKGGKEIRGERPGPFSKSKLPFILKMQKSLMKLIKTEIFFIIEDDTIPIKKNTIKKLLKHLQKPDVIIASAVEPGRNPELAPVRWGAYEKVIIKNNMLYKVIAFKKKEKGVKEAEGCGFYCFCSYKTPYKKNLEKWEEIVKKNPRWGMDIFITRKLKGNKKKIIVDFSTECYHMQLMQGKIYFFSRKNVENFACVYVDEIKTYASVL